MVGTILPCEKSLVSRTYLVAGLGAPPPPEDRRARKTYGAHGAPKTGKARRIDFLASCATPMGRSQPTVRTTSSFSPTPA